MFFFRKILKPVTGIYCIEAPNVPIIALITNLSCINSYSMIGIFTALTAVNPDQRSLTMPKEAVVMAQHESPAFKGGARGNWPPKKVSMMTIGE